MNFKTILFSSLFFYSNFLAADADWDTYRESVIVQLPKIEGWCTRPKATRMMNLIHEAIQDPSPLCVEVGVFGGSSFFPTVAALSYENKGIAYGIDPWTNHACTTGLDGVDHSWWSQVDLRKIMIGFIDLMHTQKLDNRYCMMRMTSEQSVEFFKDKSIDVLHIDGNHSDKSARYDVENWMPKVKTGGYIWFDDANWSSTKGAVAYLLQHCELDGSSKTGDDYLLFRKTAE